VEHVVVEWVVKDGGGLRQPFVAVGGAIEAAMAVDHELNGPPVFEAREIQPRRGFSAFGFGLVHVRRNGLVMQLHVVEDKVWRSNALDPPALRWCLSTQFTFTNL
jgi:hypothetical protein